MKTIFAAIALVAVTAVPASANMCIRQRDIAGTHSDDGKNLMFRMNDGRVLVNHLQESAPTCVLKVLPGTCRAPETSAKTSRA